MLCFSLSLCLTVSFPLSLSHIWCIHFYLACFLLLPSFFLIFIFFSRRSSRQFACFLLKFHLFHSHRPLDMDHASFLSYLSQHSLGKGLCCIISSPPLHWNTMWVACLPKQEGPCGSVGVGLNGSVSWSFVRSDPLLPFFPVLRWSK